MTSEKETTSASLDAMQTKAAEKYIRESRCVYCKDKNKLKCWKECRDWHSFICIDAFGDYQAHLAGDKSGYARAKKEFEARGGW